MTTSVLKSVELFAGAGGLALGIAESDILRLKKALAYKPFPMTTLFMAHGQNQCANSEMRYP